MESNYWQRILTTRLARRKALVGAGMAGAGAAALSLVGCSSGGGSKTSSPTAASGGGGSAGTPTEGGVYRATLGGTQFDSVDLQRASRDEVGWITNLVINKLVHFSNPDAGDLEADLAESWTTPDSQTYTFNLRHDVKWQTTPITNGRQFTSADVKWHIERQAAGVLQDGSAAQFRFKSDWTGVQVQTPDDYTVKITLPKPNGGFLNRLALFNQSIENREAAEKFEKTYTVLTPDAQPATNAFKFQQWETGKDVILVRNPEHFIKGVPHVDAMVYPWGLFEDPNAYRLAFEQKQVDGWSSPDASVTKSVLDAHKGQMQEVLTGVSNTVFLHLNMNQQFKDIRLVQAMNMAFDRRQAIQAFHQGLGQVSGPVTWLQEGYAVKPDDLIKYQGYRTDRNAELKDARDLWNAAGGAALGDVDVRVPDTWLGPYPDTNSILSKMFNDALGVTQFKSTKCTYNDDIIPNLSKGTYPNWFAWTNAVTSPDPRLDIVSNFTTTGSQNWNKARNSDLDTLAAQAATESDTNKAKALTLQSQDILLKNAQFGAVVLYNYISRSADWNYIHPTLKVYPSGSTPGQGYWNTAYGTLSAAQLWFIPNDPTYTADIRNRHV